MVNLLINFSLVLSYRLTKQMIPFEFIFHGEYKSVLTTSLERFFAEVHFGSQYSQRHFSRERSLKNDTTNLIVRKIEFTTHDVKHDQNPTGHPAPDPMLLTVKACSVFSKLQDQKIVGSAEPEEDSWDEMDYIALENYIEYRESLLKPPSDWDDLAKQLGQAGTRCPDGWDNGAVKNNLSWMQTSLSKTTRE